MSLPRTIERGRARAEATAGSSTSEFEYLDVTIPRQLLTNWCWAAVAAGISNAYRDPPKTQCDIAEVVLRPAKCTTNRCTTADAGCNKVKPLPLPLASHFEEQFLDADHTRFPFIQAQIHAGRPIALRIAWNAQSVGHFVVISGYRRVGSNDADIRVWDPTTGTSSEQRLSVFRLQYHSIGHWERTFKTRGNIPVPKQP